MRELYVIGLSSDGRHVLLAGQESTSRPTHALVLDERLERGLRGQSANGELPPALSPKEIQAAIRGGASVEELAASSGMATTRIARYAGPVLGEREQELATLLKATQVSRRGRSTRPLGAAVDSAVADLAFVRPETVTWTAFRREDGAWAARLSLVVRGRAKVAEWVREASGDVRPTDSWATGLGHVEAPVRKTRVVAAVPEPAPAATKAPVTKAPVTKAPARKTAAKAGKPPAKKLTKAVKATASTRATKAPAASRGRR